jgi:hypothetical protein
MQLSAELEACLREFSATGPAELRENGARVAALSSLSWEVRGASHKPLLHLWSEHHNLTRRVLAITDHSEARLTLAVECFGRGKPDRLEFLRIDYDREEREISRERFAQETRELCERQFPDETVESMTTAADLEHTLSSNYARGILKRGREACAVFAVPESEARTDPARCLTFALLWLDRVRQRTGKRQATGLRMLLPRGSAAPVAHLLPVLQPGLTVQIFERDPVMEEARRIEPSEVANFTSTIVAVKEAQSLLDRALAELAPHLPADRSALSFHPNTSIGDVVVRFRGLACLRWHESRIFFGARETRLKEDNRPTPEIQQMFRELEARRHPLSDDARQQLFRAQPERWLEFLVRQDVTRIDSALDQRFAYGQTLASTGGEHGVLDVLSVTRAGRLAILELKVAEQPALLLQAAKYWQRIQRHLQQGDFSGNGYFPGVALQRKSPLIYLVAPALRFHPATDVVLKYLHPEIEVIRVGISESWRRGLCVVLRH